MSADLGLCCDKSTCRERQSAPCSGRSLFFRASVLWRRELDYVRRNGKIQKLVAAPIVDETVCGELRRNKKLCLSISSYARTYAP